MRLPALLLALAATPALAEPPVVVADIAPIHSLVAQVMEGVGTPELLLPGGEALHESGLSPSRASALEGADVVIWTGATMLPWLADALPALAPDAAALALLDSPGWEPMTTRAADLAADPAETGEPGTLDPHAWLDPDVAAVWVGTIAEALAAADPEGAATYRTNADRAKTAILAQGEALATRFAPLAETPFVLGHDASQYFERATGLAPRWALVPAHGGTPPASVVEAVTATLASGEARCILADAETPPALTEALTAGTDARVVQADPEGVALEPGPGLYAALMDGMAAAAEACLAP